MAADGVTVIDEMASRGHEQVVFVADRPTGLRAVIAVHSTALGPSLGGIRFWKYQTEADAVRDALRLSEAMTLKAAVAGLHQGGGKAVVLVDDPDRPRPEALLRAMGRAIDELGGRYIAAEDVGATPRDMDVIARETPWVTGVDEELGGSGDPSPVTAVGVLHGMRAVCAEIFGDPALHGRRVVVQGAGHVGAHLVALLRDAGAEVGVADVNRERAAEVAARNRARLLEARCVVQEPCDVLAPCALGGVISSDVVPLLRCRAIVGAANNQLSDSSVALELAARGIVYAPDFVVNAGGIINIAEEFVGYSRARALEKAERIEETTARVLHAARAMNVTTEKAAEELAIRRIEEEALPGGRWRPGSPTAWTAGKPLRTLRPTP
jgi:leucine dehydrogenase